MSTAAAHFSPIRLVTCSPLPPAHSFAHFSPEHRGRTAAAVLKADSLQPLHLAHLPTCALMCLLFLCAVRHRSTGLLDFWPLHLAHLPTCALLTCSFVIASCAAGWHCGSCWGGGCCGCRVPGQGPGACRPALPDTPDPAAADGAVVGGVAAVSGAAVVCQWWSVVVTAVSNVAPCSGGVIS
eukprot:scaffold203302_cov15-Tisochrysis_lutea.AAC.1